MALGLLRREIGGGTHDGTGLGEVDRGVAGGDRLGDTEVGDLHLTSGRDEDVSGLDIAMYDTVSMSEGKGGRDVSGDLSGAIGVQRSLGVDDLGERTTLDVLHHDEVGAELLTPVVDRHDVGMVEVGGGLSFATEALDEEFIAGVFGEEHLDRHGAIKQEVAGQIHVGHATAGEFAMQFVAVVEHCRR